MSRKIPEFQKGHYYHLYNRGADKADIFFEEENYLFLLRRMAKYASKVPVSIIAYCLMPNHYHFLVRQNSDDAAGKFIQRIFNSYTKAINYKYNRSGTLFEGPYKAIHIDDESYLIHLCRYIHRNPPEAHLVKNIEDWPYSNYLEWINLRNGNLYDAEFVRTYFPSGKKYKAFVEQYESPKKITKYLF